MNSGPSGSGTIHVIANPGDPIAQEKLKLIVEAPPVTELVTETPLENGGQSGSAALGVIGGK